MVGFIPKLNSGWGFPLGLILAGSMFIGCPKDDEEEVVLEASTVDIPKELSSMEAMVLLRFTNASSTSSAVHRSLANILTQRILLSDVIMRGGYDPDQIIGTGNESSASPEEQLEMLGGSSLEQVRAFFDRAYLDEEPLWKQGTPVDACGNEMIAGFLTPNMLQHVYPVGDPSKDLGYWPASCGNDLDCDSSVQGTWDLALTEMRNDGMMDMIIQVYPAPTVGNPGWSGHLLAFFLSDNNPGFLVAPLFGNASKVTVAAMGLLQIHGSPYLDSYMRPAEIFKFPHQTRSIATSDIVVAMIASDLCEKYWTSNFDGPVPFGCDLESGFSMPMLLDTDNEGGSFIKEAFMPTDNDTGPLQQVIDTLAYQIKALAACPTLSSPEYVREGPVELFICTPESGTLDECLGMHDMEQAGCEVDGISDPAATPLEPIAVEPDASPYGAPLIEVLDTPYAISEPTFFTCENDTEITMKDVCTGFRDCNPEGEDEELCDGFGYVELVVPSSGPPPSLYTSTPGQILSVLDEDGVSVGLPDSVPNSHCDNVADPIVFDVEPGNYLLEIDVSTPVTLLWTQPDFHIPG